MTIHKDLTLDRWFKFSIFEQLANVGMDVERTIQWKNKGNTEYSKQALDRALELLDFTIVDPKNRGGRLKELLRVREALKDYFLFNNEYSFTDQFWQSYFYEFAYAAAVMRGK